LEPTDVTSPTPNAYRRFGSLSEADVAAAGKELSKIVGAERVLSGAAAQQKHPGDQSWLTYIHAHFGQPLNRPDLAVAPVTTEQVSAVMRVASQRGIPVTPVGGASGVQGAANVNCGGILLDLSGMNQVRDIDLMSLTCTVETGMIVKTFEEQLNAKGLSFTHYPASAEWASVGGSVAARGSGVLSTKYGNIQDHVLSVEVVLPGGEVVDLPSVPRHGVGPEMTQLFVGSEGTLGVITAVRVKLRRVPVKRRFSAFRFPTLADGIEAGRQIMTSGLRPPVMRLYDKEAATQSLEKAVHAGLDGETMVLMVDGDHERMIELEGTLCDEICVAHRGQPLSASIGQTWWDRRYVFYHPPHAPQLPQIWCTMDAVSDYRHIRALYENVTRAMRESIDPKWGLTLKTHLSHWFDWGAMIYPRFGIPKGPENLDAAIELHDRIITAAVRASLESGGVMNDHHGVGMRLAPHLRAQFGDAGIALLRSIKNGIDPKHILCPGKMAMQVNPSEG
jgi:alkyldihydroxyacetonephosphate synthase